MMTRNMIRIFFIAFLSLSYDHSWDCVTVERLRLVRMKHFLEQEFDDQESPKKKDKKEDCQEVEISVDKGFNFWPEFSEEGSHGKESERAADSGSEQKQEKVQLEDSGGNGEHFVRNGSKASGKDVPESVGLIVYHHFLKQIFRKSGDVLVEKGIHSSPNPVADEVTDDSSDH